LDELVPQLLPYISVFDKGTGDEFYEYDPYNKSIHPLNPSIKYFNEKNHKKFIEMGNLLKENLSKRLCPWEHKTKDDIYQVLTGSLSKVRNNPKDNKTVEK